MNDIRLRRVESVIREKISMLIMTGTVKDPRVDASLSINRVKVAKNLTSARLWVSSLGGVDASKRAVEGLNSAAGFLQARIAKEVRLRYTPKLYFVPDDSIRAGLAVNQLIEKTMSSQQSSDKSLLPQENSKQV